MKAADSRLMALVGLTLLVCGILGGANFILVKSLVNHISPLHLVAARVVLAGAILTAWLVSLKRLPRVGFPLLRGAAVLAMIDAIVPYVLIALAASHVQASTSALLVSTMPLFTALFVSAVDRSSVPANVLLGLAVGAFGVSVLVGPTAFQPGSSADLAMLAVLLAAASYAAGAVYSRGTLQTVDPISLSAAKFVIAGMVLVPAVVFHEGIGGYGQLDLHGWLGLLGIGFFVTGLARCGYVWVISVAGSVPASLLTYVVPAAALVLGFVFMGETMTWEKGLGATLIAISITLVLFGRMLAKGALFRRLATLRPAQN